MKRLILLLVVLVGCGDSYPDKPKLEGAENHRVSKVKFEGVNYLLIEYGCRGCKGYSFSVIRSDEQDEDTNNRKQRSDRPRTA